MLATKTVSTFAFNPAMVKALTEFPFQPAHFKLQFSEIIGDPFIYIDGGQLILSTLGASITLKIIESKKKYIIDLKNDKQCSIGCRKCSKLIFKLVTNIIEQYANYVDTEYKKFYTRAKQLKFTRPNANYDSIDDIEVDNEFYSVEVDVNVSRIKVIVYEEVPEQHSPNKIGSFYLPTINKSINVRFYGYDKKSVINNRIINLQFYKLCSILNAIDFISLCAMKDPPINKGQIAEPRDVKDKLVSLNMANEPVNQKTYKLDIKKIIDDPSYELHFGIIKFERLENESDAPYKKTSDLEYVLDILSFIKGVKLGDSRDDQYLSLLLDSYLEPYE